MTTSLQLEDSLNENTSWWNNKKHVTYHSIEPTTNTKRIEMFANDKLLDKCEYVTAR